MVQYSKYTQGDFKKMALSETEIWHSVHNYFYHGKNSTTYKFILFKSLLENISDVNENNELAYTLIFDTFAEIAWNLIASHGLWQSNKINQKAAVQQIIEAFQEEFRIPSEWSYD